jgi:cyclopropane fatty-acyl-phospholipid synthase-like methyltransferase
MRMNIENPYDENPYDENPYDEKYHHFQRARAKFEQRRFRPRTALYAFADFTLPLRVCPGRRLLELGSQFGDVAHYVSMAGARVVGIDLNDAALRAGHDMWRRCQQPVRGDFSCERFGLGFRDEAFDGVYSRDVLEHLPGPQSIAALFDELRRVTRPGARMVHIVTITEDGPNLDADPSHHVKADGRWWREFFSQQGYVVGRDTRAFGYGDNGQGWKKVVRHEGRFVLTRR